jgi:hypothetical protein
MAANTTDVPLSLSKITGAPLVTAPPLRRSVCARTRSRDCSAWREAIEAGRRCPSCEAGAWLRIREGTGRTMPPLSRFLPDGRPFKPDLARAEAVHQAAATVTELEMRRAVRRGVEPELEAG